MIALDNPIPGIKLAQAGAAPILKPLCSAISSANVTDPALARTVLPAC